MYVIKEFIIDYYTLFVVYSKDELSKFETGTVSAVATGALVYGGLIALYMAFPPAALASGAILTAVNSFAATATVGTAVVTSFKYGYAFGDAEGIDWKASHKRPGCRKRSFSWGGCCKGKQAGLERPA